MDWKSIFSINIKLGFTESFQFLGSSLDSSIKNLNNDGFMYLSQEFYNNLLNLVRQKGFYLYE